MSERSNERLTRVFGADLEIRGGDGRTLVGLCAPFDAPTHIDMGRTSYREVIRPGAFARTIAERGPSRVKLLNHHDHHQLPVGRATALREDARGLVGEFRISKTQTGDEVIELVRDGSLDGLSIGFSPILSEWANDHSLVERLEVRLHEVSVCNFPAYSEALIDSVRSAGSPQLSVARMRLELLRTPPNG